MVRTVLLLGAESEVAEHLAQAAEELDIRLHVATHRTLYRDYGDALRHRLAGIVFTDFRIPLHALEQLTEHCVQGRIGGVGVSWKFLSPLGALLAARLGLPGHEPAIAPATRNKWLMAEAFHKRGVPHPRTLAVTTLDSGIPSGSAAGLGYPVVVKPAESAGSMGVIPVDSPDDLAGMVRMAQRRRKNLPYGAPVDTTVLIQQHVEGMSCGVVTAVHQGEYTHLAIMRNYTTAGRFREDTGHTMPAGFGLRTEALILSTVESGLTALGLRDGVAHSDLKVTEAGPKVIAVDVGPPDVPTMQAIELATGVNTAAVYLQTVLGERPSTRPRRTDAAAIRFISTVRHGVFRGLDGLAQSPHVALVRSYVQPGDLIGSAHRKYTRLGHVIVQAPSPDLADQRADAAIAGISSRVEP